MDGAEWIRLEPALNDFAVIRTTFETLAYFPGDEEMRQELLEIIEEARQKSSDWLHGVITEIAAHPDRFPSDLDELRDILLSLMRNGYPGRSLNVMMRLDPFEDGTFYLPWPDGIVSKEADQIPGLEFFLSVLRSLRKRVTDRANCVDKKTFGSMVFQPFIAIMFAHYATTDPIFYPPRSSP